MIRLPFICLSVPLSLRSSFHPPFGLSLHPPSVIPSVLLSLSSISLLLHPSIFPYVPPLICRLQVLALLAIPIWRSSKSVHNFLWRTFGLDAASTLWNENLPTKSLLLAVSTLHISRLPIEQSKPSWSLSLHHWASCDIFIDHVKCVASLQDNYSYPEVLPVQLRW